MKHWGIDGFGVKQKTIHERESNDGNRSNTQLLMGKDYV